MKKLAIFLTLVGAFLSCGLQAQHWETDFEAALKKAKAENKVVLVNFTGSDWCGWCKRLQREVFMEDTFKTYAAQNLVLLELDFPKYKQLPESQQRKNRELANKYGIRGFPTVLLMDEDEGVLLQTGYKAGGAEAYVKHLEEAIAARG